MNNTNPTMNAKEILENVRTWSAADVEKRASVLVLRDEADGYCYHHHSATEPEMSKMIAEVMARDKDMARAIFATATLYAKRCMTPDEIEEISKKCDIVIAVSDGMTDDNDDKDCEA